MERRAPPATRIKPLDRKIPKNPKYEHVKATLSTGPTIRDVPVVSDKMVAKRRGEIFHRVKASTLAKKLAEAPETGESVYQMGREDDGFDDAVSVRTAVTAMSAASTSVVSVADTDMGFLSEGSFIVLDCREADEFRQYHIVEARSFPASMLNQDKMVADVLKYKNKENKQIVVYMKDERSGMALATVFVQKGFDNIYLLTGGIDEFAGSYPDLIQGSPPVPTASSPRGSSISRISKTPSTRSTATATTTRSIAPSMASRR